MKASERYLAYWAIILTIVTALAILQFRSINSKALEPRTLGPIVPVNNRMPVRRSTATLGGEAAHNTTPHLRTDAADDTSTPPQTNVTAANDAPVPNSPTIPLNAVASLTPRGMTMPPPDGPTIRGFVVFEGTPPKRKKLPLERDPQCSAMHPNGAFDESIIINENGTLKNVFVYVAGGLEDTTYETPKSAVTLEERGCQYSPRVFGLQVGQTLVITNADDTLHNVHSFSSINPDFNKGLPFQSPAFKRIFAKPEVMIAIKCDIHIWDRAYIGVLDHPFFATTTETGVFSLGPLPAGTYSVVAWHETYGIQTQQVTLAQNELKEIRFVYRGK